MGLVLLSLMDLLDSHFYVLNSRQIVPFWLLPEYIDQGLSKHQEVSSTTVTKVTKLIFIFGDLLGAMKRYILKHRFHVVHMNYW